MEIVLLHFTTCFLFRHFSESFFFSPFISFFLFIFLSFSLFLSLPFLLSVFLFFSPSLLLHHFPCVCICQTASLRLLFLLLRNFVIRANEFLTGVRPFNLLFFLFLFRSFNLLMILFCIHSLNVILNNSSKIPSFVHFIHV